MNPETPCKKSCAGVYTLGVLGTFLVMGAMVWLMRSYTQPPDLSAVRGQERMKIKADFNLANEPLTDPNVYDWVDKDKDIVRIPVDRAKELILQEWQDPQAGRALLLKRETEATAPVAKRVSKFE